ncbi:asparaginase [Longispora albida]|uniref:asparaginase n=1 Tax=Longispora albida TaxID=203523 RepID=UPI0003747ADA|nr:asparaginase [Longispora albida]
MSVTLFTLGGTISMAGQSEAGGVVARLTGADLTRAVPGLDASEIEIRDTQKVPSANLTFAQVLDVVAEAGEAVKAGAEGVVVTQGTDTLEESAYLADLVWPHSAPLVFTGAMRNPTLAGPDGPANLLAAIRVASAPAARDLGALVAFNDEVHAARWVRKTHATSTATFGSPVTGPIGYFAEGEARLLTRPLRHLPLSAPSPEALAATRVPVHQLVFDDESPLPAGVAGLVMSAFGVGHVPARLVPELAGLASAVPVVLCSRTGAGPVLTSTYGGPGSEQDLLEKGLINAGLLHPYKARILLRLLLANGASRTAIREAFAQHG